MPGSWHHLDTLILWAVLLLVIVQRLAELRVARRHTRHLLSQGGYEVGANHYPLIVAIHTGWLLALLALLVTGSARLQLVPLCLYLILQPLRLWVMMSLGQYWTTRVIVLPQAPLIRRGPYRLFRHPNYLIVVMEIALLPLAFGAWHIALLFSGLNAAALSLRLGVESGANQSRPINHV
ncbi:MAG TPA: isoprenylcysteine carboxylmethyltransferase family protein [Dongiaceae bacterium]